MSWGGQTDRPSERPLSALRRGCQFPSESLPESRLGGAGARDGANMQQNLPKNCDFPYENTIFSSSIRSAARGARPEEVISQLLEGK
jgi:hypothetical protein